MGKVLGAITISVDDTEPPAVTWCVAMNSACPGHHQRPRQQ
jgi:hypothetical protein